MNPCAIKQTCRFLERDSGVEAERRHADAGATLAFVAAVERIVGQATAELVTAAVELQFGCEVTKGGVEWSADLSQRHCAVCIGCAGGSVTGAIQTFVIACRFKPCQVTVQAKVKAPHVDALHACGELRHTVEWSRDAVTNGIGQVLQGLPHLCAHRRGVNPIGPIQARIV